MSAPKSNTLLVRRLLSQSVLTSTRRNGGIGFAIGGVLLAMRYRKARKNSKRWERFKQEWIICLLRYPIFLATFTIMYRGLNNIGKELLTPKNLKLFQFKFKLNFMRNTKFRRVCAVICAFFCGYVSQLCSPIFTWNWALYALMRALLALIRSLVPSDLSVRPGYVYVLIHGLLALFMGYNTKYVEQAYANWFRSCLDEMRQPNIDMFGGHSHGVTPPCYRALHPRPQKPNTCLHSLVLDYCHRYQVSFRWYFKFYAITSMLGGMHFLRKAVSKPLQILWHVLTQTLRSCTFLTTAHQLPVFHSCVVKWCVTLYHRQLRGDEYAWIANNLPSVACVACALVGGLAFNLETPESKQTDINLFVLWKMAEQVVRARCGLQTYDRDCYHPVLSDARLSAIIFGMACAITIYVRITNKSAVKKLEQTILEYILK